MQTNTYAAHEARIERDARKEAKRIRAAAYRPQWEALKAVKVEPRMVFLSKPLAYDQRSLDRAARRRGDISARQQRKAIKAARRHAWEGVP